MTPQEATQRILKSRRVLTGWQGAHAAGELAAKPSEYLRMIADELVVLDAIASDFPAKRETLDALAGQWRDLAASLRKAMH